MKKENTKKWEDINVGDGVTVTYWTDANAYTVIKRTAKTLTLQRDKAILDKNFKPDFIPGGFCAHCTNQNEQSYEYEKDENGEIVTAYWSEAKRGFYVDKSLRLIKGRHEFYDYNF